MTRHLFSCCDFQRDMNDFAFVFPSPIPRLPMLNINKKKILLLKPNVSIPAMQQCSHVSIQLKAVFLLFQYQILMIDGVEGREQRSFNSCLSAGFNFQTRLPKEGTFT